MADFVKHSLIKDNSIESRVFQEVLVERVLEKGNSLIVAPTALGKTIVAVMLSAKLLEKEKNKKILLLSPTKPLAVQHHKTFVKLMNVPEEKIILLTGSLASKKRIPLWRDASIISATPQSIENDLIKGKISLKDISVIIFDEAHRAVKDYSYVFLAQKYVKDSSNGLILGLTASPGGRVERIKDVMKNLFIKNVEIKSETDEDVKPYTHEIEMEWLSVSLPEEFLEIKKLLREFMQEQLKFLKKIGYARGINAGAMRRKQLIELQLRIIKDVKSKGERFPALYQAALKCASILKIAHAELLLETQGITSLHEYFDKMNEKSASPSSPKSLKFILNRNEIIKAINLTNQLFESKIVHPKVGKLIELLEEQFRRNPESRVIVFNHYRDSAKFLENYLNEFSFIKARKFIGQAMKQRDKGMSQKEQVEVINDLKEGKYNTIIATSVAEEGLDIPEVDLVVFFEAVPSEIRSIQRRGRTGRLGKGKAVILMAKGTSDEGFYWSAIAKERKMKNTLYAMKQKDELKERKMDSQTTLTSFNGEAKDKIVIYVDSREESSNVSRELSRKENVFVRVKQLEVGDYVLSDQVIVERKTVEDFLQSMIDGRLFNQLIDMSANYDKPLLLIEGNKDKLYNLRNIHENAIKGCLTAIALDYRTPILFTKDLEETVSFLYLTAKREQLGKYRDIKLRIGRKGLTQQELQKFIVESLPSVGPVLARNLLKEFGSIEKIFTAKEEELKKTEMLGEKKAKEIRKIIEAKYSEEK